MPSRRKSLGQAVTQVDALQKRPDSVAAGKRDRSWDERNPRFSFRIHPGDAERLARLAADRQVSRDALARGLMAAALDAVEQKWLTLEVYEERNDGQDRLGRYWTSVRRFVRTAWDTDRNRRQDE